MVSKERPYPALTHRLLSGSLNVGLGHVMANSGQHQFRRIQNLLFLQPALGIGQARRGWLEARNVLNTRPLAELVNKMQRRLRLVDGVLQEH